MRKILRGLAVATALTLTPLSATAIATSPAQASESVVVKAGSPTTSAPASTNARAKANRTISVKDTRGRDARLRIFVRPEFGNKPIIIQTRKAGKFKTTGRVRTNAKGVAIKVFAGSFRGITYRLIAVGGTKYNTAAVKFTITKRRI